MQNLILPAFSAVRHIELSEIDRIIRCLEQTPQTFLPPARNRTFWSNLPFDKEAVVCLAEKELRLPLPKLSDEMYLDFMKSNRRETFNIPFDARFDRLTCLALAEAVDFQGRFLPELIRVIDAILLEPSWVYSMHDGPNGYAAFRGESIYVDLGVAMRGASLAAARGWLGDQLGEERSERIMREISRRIVFPYLDFVYYGTGKKELWWWVTAETNWNAVCHAGILYSALAVIDDSAIRARVAASVASHTELYFKGFAKDGYVSEGLGYWNYGFGHFILTAESLFRATQGNINLFLNNAPKAATVAAFPLNIEIAPEVYPAFSDCRINIRPQPWMLRALALRYAQPFRECQSDGRVVKEGLYFTDLSLSLPSPPESKGAGTAGVDSSRSYFPEAGVVVVRPGKGKTGLSIAAKGGNNDEMHNHNDVGSYILVSNKQPVVTDPGMEVYTRRTFSELRYESQVINSYGHPVPTIDGKLQIIGAKALGEIIRYGFQEDLDEWEIDITSAYSVEGLESVRRLFSYRRTEDSSLVIQDTFISRRPTTFATALITLGSFQYDGTGGLSIIYQDAKVYAEISTEGQPFELREEALNEELPDQLSARRLEIRLVNMVCRAVITVQYFPDKDTEIP